MGACTRPVGVSSSTRSLRGVIALHLGDAGECSGPLNVLHGFVLAASYCVLGESWELNGSLLILLVDVVDKVWIQREIIVRS